MGEKLGQHFLKSEKIQRRIADAVLRTHPQTVIEIGPGKGALTQHLMSAPRLIGVEIDSDLAAHIRDQFPAATVVESDVMVADLDCFGPATICGNLPYYLTSAIVEKVLSMRGLERAVFLIQREPAERICSGPGSRAFGYLSVLVQAQAEAKLLFGVKPGAFQPAPKVDSAVIELTPRPLVPPGDLAAFLKFASRCFLHKRKNLRNNLSDYLDWLDTRPEAKLRAEQLSVSQLYAVFLDWRASISG